MPVTVTLDTNVSPPDTITASVPTGLFDFAVVSVSNRETAGTRYQVRLSGLGRVHETLVWGESTWGSAVWGGDDDADRLEALLRIISHGGFPEAGARDNLTAGQRRQLRDAMIFCAHVREGRDIFVTNDANGFIDEGRRGELETRFRTRIMTPAEFLSAHGTSRP